jgi:glycosyltransferase involved in cell wall biosynthesis
MHNYEHIPDREFDWEVFRSKQLSLGATEVIVNVNSATKLLTTDADALLVGGWNYTAAWEVLLASKLNRIPAALLSENLSQRTSISNAIAKKFVPQFDAYFAASSGAKKNLISLGAISDHVTVLPYCIDVEAFQNGIYESEMKAIRDKYEITAENVILYVGLLSERKGVDDLITAAAEFDSDSTHLLIVGDGPQRAELEALAADIDTPTTFTGNIPNHDLPNYYAMSTVFVLPTRNEPWGLVQNEALACGTPVVTTTASGAVGDLIFDGENGLVVSPNAPDELRAAIVDLLENPEKRQHFVENGLERCEEFTPRRYAEVMKQTVDEMIARQQ